MKWNKKGHQFDETGRKWVEEFHKKDGIWIFGAGIYGKEFRVLFEKYHCFSGFIDNNVHKKDEIQDCEVCSLDEYLNKQGNYWIIIAAEDIHALEIKKQLKSVGKKEGEDFFNFRKFINIFAIISMYDFGKLYSWMSEITITERCTLKCKKCVHGCGMVDINSEDITLEDVKSSADFYFKNFDYVTEFCLIGGETLLYKQLPEVVEYIGKTYRDQMIIFSITTNGTIVPSDELVELMKKYHVVYRISDYSRALPQLKFQHKKIVEVLGKAGVDYRFAYQDKDTIWYDYGYEDVDRKGDERELTETFDKCLTTCHAVRKNRYYFCAGARAASENLGMQVGENDYFDLANCENKMELFEYNMGYSEKGYLDMCNFCNGSDSKKYPIPVAEQI